MISTPLGTTPGELLEKINSDIKSKGFCIIPETHPLIRDLPQIFDFKKFTEENNFEFFRVSTTAELHFKPTAKWESPKT